MRKTNVAMLSIFLLAGCSGAGSGGTVNSNSTTLNSSIPGLSTFSSISAGDIGSLNGGTSLALNDHFSVDRFRTLWANIKHVMPSFISFAYASTSSTSPTACVNTATKFAGTRDDVNWSQLQISANQTEPCLSSIQDGGSYLIATSPNVKDVSGNVCDLIFVKKVDGSLFCFNNALESGASRTLNYALGTDNRPAFSPQIGMGTNQDSAYLSQNGNFFYAPYSGSNGLRSFVGITSFDLTDPSGPIGNKVTHLSSGNGYSYSLVWFQGMENGDAYVSYSKNFDPGGADLTQSYFSTTSASEAVIARGSYTATNSIPTYSSDLLKDFAANLNGITWTLYNNYQVIPDPQASPTNKSFFAVQLPARRLLKVTVDSQNNVSISDFGDTRVRYYFFTEGGAAYGPAAYYNNSSANHSVGDECQLVISNNYNALDCDFYLVKHDLTNPNASDEKLLRLFVVGKNAWDYVPFFRTATKIFIPNYNAGSGGDPFFGETMWNNTIPFPSTLYVVDTTNGLNSSSPVSSLSLNTTGLDVSKTKIKSFNINKPRDLFLVKGVMTDGSGTFTSKIGASGISKLTKYGKSDLFPDGIQFIAN